MTGKITLAAVVAGIVLMLWGVVFWMVLPFSNAAYRELPREAEFSAALLEHAPADGVYLLPSMGHGEGLDAEAAQERFETRYAAGPRARLYVRRGGGDPLSPMPYLLGFGHNVVSAWLLALLLAFAAPSMPAFASRYLFTALAGLFAAVFIDLQTPIWFFNTWDEPLLLLSFHVLGWLAAAVPIAAIVKVDPAQSGSTV